MKKLGKGGFSMIELLVVLLIIGILAAVAAPLFLGNTERAKASEAVAVLGQIRSAEREYYSKHKVYLAVASGNLANDPEAAAAQGLGITIGAVQYFSTACYSVVLGGNMGDGTAAADFVATADGSLSAAFAAGVGARQNTDVAAFTVQMDNSGKTIKATVATPAAANFSAY